MRVSLDLAAVVGQMRDVRRDLHANPELSGLEHRTTGLVRDRLAAIGLSPRVLPTGTGLTCEIAGRERSGDTPVTGAPPMDLHRSPFDVDEAATEVGIRTLVAVGVNPQGGGA